jgi:phosphate transport system substrate-binding protein
MKTKQLSTVLMTVALLGGMSAQAAPALINGAGATFPFPLYSKWFTEYQKVDPEVQINYQSIGSGGGIRQFTEKTVDFGASDAPMTDEQIAKVQDVLHIPTVLGAVVLTYNLPGLTKPLVLSGDVVADIFLGTITKWDDARIAKLNPGVKLPGDAILVAHRSDGSGTSAIFTDYLSKVSADWKSKVGAGPAVNWPTGLGGKGNEGVTGLVKQTPGALGYVELIYAKNNNLAYASLKNHAGKVVEPSTASVTAAAAGSLKTIPADFRVSITDATGAGAYPISGFTYLLVSKNMGKDKGTKIVKFLKWAVADGQKFAEPMYYAPLPKALVTKVKARIAEISVK